MGGFKIGRLFGFPIEVRYSFLLLLAFAFIAYGGLSGVLLLLVTFGSVLAHELGHAIVARRLGVQIVNIELHFFGGAARMANMPSRPRDEIIIAAAGPAVSFALALLGGLLFAATGFRPVLHLAVINLILAVFNLLPALPMDGGRILRATLARRMGRLKATAIAVKVARVVAIGLGIFGLVSSHLFLVALAVMLWLMAGAELQATQLWHQAANGSGPFDGAGFSPFANPFVSPPRARSSSDQGVDVLDSSGRVINGAHDRAHDGAHMGGAPRGFANMTIEEQRSANGRRWVIRGPNGEVLFATERPLYY